MQDRKQAFDNISRRLANIRCDIEQHQAIQDYSLNNHSENFFRDVFNCVYDCRFENANFQSANAACIDLLDANKKLAYQITSTTSKEKITNTLQALAKPEYQGFEIRMFYLLGKPDLSAKSKQEIRTDFAINIDEHLFDYSDLIKDINDLETDKLIALNQKCFKETNQAQNDTTVNITDSTVHGSVAVAGEISNSFNETHHHHYAEKPNTPPEVDISHLPDSAVAAIAMPSAPILGARLAAGAGLACTSTSTFASALPFIILGARGYGIYKSLFDDKSDDSNPLCTNEKENNHIYSVWFGTTRKPINKNDLSKGFRNERETDKNMYYGKCNVFIPKSHRFGETGRSWFQRWAKLDFENDNLKLREIIPCDNANSFWLELKNQFAENKGDALVYLHGYNTSFEEAAIRAAQIGFDLKVSGATAFFSWASKSEVSGYPNDVASIEASEMAITDFLLDFTQKSGASKVHLIAHSMGNRGLIRALNNIQHKLEKDFAVPFGQIILAAPDLDVQLFKNLAYLYPLLSERTTLYASPQDKAVAASKWLHGSPRVGIAPPITIVKDIDTIKVEIEGFDLFELGHSYFAEAESILHDMYDLLRHNSEPSDRQRLRKEQAETGDVYWLMSS